MINYKNHFLIFLVSLVLTILFWVFVVFIVLAAQTPQKSIVGFTELFYEAPSVPLYPITEYDEIIEKLIQCESRGDPNAIGDSGRAKGILQFHEATFQQYCVEKYGYYDDIWWEEIQKNCCAEMLRDGLENQWSCYQLI